MYEVSSDGRVRSLYYRNKELKPYTQKWGHQEVKLRKNKVSHAKGVHVLVAEAFLGSRPPGLDVCHNDGNASNNTVGNLRFGTRASNIRDSVSHRTHRNSRKTHCSKGHEFDAENTRWKGDERVCRTCHRESENVRRSKRPRN